MGGRRARETLPGPAPDDIRLLRAALLAGRAEGKDRALGQLHARGTAGTAAARALVASRRGAGLADLEVSVRHPDHRRRVRHAVLPFRRGGHLIETSLYLQPCS